jgi:SagB-type dehydrogenase family enzyme
MLDATDSRSLALLYHLNSEPWLGADADEEHGFEFHVKEMPGLGPSVALPAPVDGGLLDLVVRRSSCREYSAEPLALDSLATLLAGTYGLTRPVPIPEGLELRARSVPSAGGLYPLELYLLLRDVEALADGLYHYNAVDHALEPLREEIERTALAEFLLAAHFLENANALVFISAVFDRTLHKYGARGYRYILLEAGHAAQNLCLLAAERDLATLCVGGFGDAALNRFLELDPRTEGVVYCIGVGHPA